MSSNDLRARPVLYVFLAVGCALGAIIVFGSFGLLTVLSVFGVIGADDTSVLTVFVMLLLCAGLSLILLMAFDFLAQFFRALILLRRSFDTPRDSVLGTVERIGVYYAIFRPYPTTSWSTFWDGAGTLWNRWRIAVAAYALVLIPAVVYVWPFAKFGAFAAVLGAILLVVAVAFVVWEVRLEPARREGLPSVKSTNRKPLS